jgi:hypothetical protein
MKRFVFIIAVFLVTFASCRKKSSSSEQPAIQEPGFKTTGFDQNRWIGRWINVRYHDVLMKTGSPREAVFATKYEDATTIDIELDTSKTYPLICGVGYHFHEGEEGGIYPADSLFLYTWAGRKGEKSTIFLSNDTLFFETEKYVRLPDGTYITELLLKGRYKNGETDVDFESNGQIFGLDSLKFYDLILNYGDAGTNLPEVFLGPNKDNLLRFPFSFKDDTLRIFKEMCIEGDATECLEIGYGELLFTLVRVK